MVLEIKEDRLKWSNYLVSSQCNYPFRNTRFWKVISFLSLNFVLVPNLIISNCHGYSTCATMMKQRLLIIAGHLGPSSFWNPIVSFLHLFVRNFIFFRLAMVLSVPRPFVWPTGIYRILLLLASGAVKWLYIQPMY